MRPAACGRRRSRTPRDRRRTAGRSASLEGRRPQRFSLVTFRVWEPHALSWPQRFPMTDADVAALVGAPVDRDRGGGYQPWPVEPDPEPVWRVAWTIPLPRPEGMDRGCIRAAPPWWRCLARQLIPRSATRDCCYYHQGQLAAGERGGGPGHAAGPPRRTGRRGLRRPGSRAGGGPGTARPGRGGAGRRAQRVQGRAARPALPPPRRVHQRTAPHDRDARRRRPPHRRRPLAVSG